MKAIKLPGSKVANIRWPGGHLAKKRLPYWHFSLAT
jgi:hypothetical protein